MQSRKRHRIQALLLLFVLQLALQPRVGAFACDGGSGVPDCCCEPPVEAPEPVAEDCCITLEQRSEPAMPEPEQNEDPCRCELTPGGDPLAPPVQHVAGASCAVATLWPAERPAVSGPAPLARLARMGRTPPLTGSCSLLILHQVFRI